MKISWGTGIGALYGSFVLMILVMVGMSVVQKIDLVTDKYYEEEIQYQGKIDKVKNTGQLATPLTWEVAETGIEVNYPADLKNISGVIYFYCPSDNRKDFKVKIQPNSQFSQHIPTQTVRAGRYRIQFDWQANGVGYWNEGILNL
ncbi:FixH family protein [Runella sp.]|uniref:FixH family protein n=1 Tax=Runella sp. TaxID=1960881 RepID=UPI003D0BFF15